MRITLAIFTALLALALTAGIGLAFQGSNEQGPQLSIEQISWQPDAPRAGDPVVFSVTYGYTGTREITNTTPVTMSLTVVGGRDTAGAACSHQETVAEASGMPAGDQNIHDFAPCFFLDGGSYTATVTMKAGALQAESGRAGNPPAATIAVGPAVSALPDQWTQVFAGLGMFAAIMAIVAAGTEVVIDSLKVGLGMKSKVTALDALNQMENVLPGQLASLGVGAAALEQFQELKRNLNSTLEKVWQPATEVRRAADAIQRGAFSEAYRAITNLIPRKGQVVAADKLADLKEGAKATLGALDTLQVKLGLSRDFVATIKRDVSHEIDSVTIGTSAEFLERLFGRLQDPRWPQEVVEGWLEKQRDTLLVKGQEAVMRLFEQEVRPELEGIGMEAAVVEKIQQNLTLALSFADTKAMAATNSYLRSLENLLMSVEARRVAMQSPTRKLWRRLREASHGFGLVVAVVALVLAKFVAWLQLHLIWMNLLDMSITRAVILDTLLAFLLTYGVLRLLAWKGGQIYQVKVKPGGEITALQKVEVCWNWLRGDQHLDPAQFGRPPSSAEVMGKITGSNHLTVDTAAEVVMARSDQQEDEESSRLRWLRVISVLVGFVLAYVLQVDAAVLLNAVIPGVGDSINAVFYFSGGKLHALWPRFPAALDLTAGMILTGLAASAGSAYWHDQLDRLQASKPALEKVATLVRQAKGKVE